MEQVTKCHSRGGDRLFSQLVEWNWKSELQPGFPFLRKHSASRVGASSSLSVTTTTETVAAPTVSITRLEDFPADVIVNILSRLPMNSLMCCRCICKIWLNIIDSPSFTNMHFTSTAEEPKLWLLKHAMDRPQKTRFLPLIDDGAQVLRPSPLAILEMENSNDYVADSLCYGLFCFRNVHHTGQVFLSNPLRGEVLMLPPTTVTPDVDHYGVGFDCTTETYKVVRVFPRKLDNDLPHDLATQVYTLGTGSWREIPAAPPCCVRGGAVSAYGDVHWVGYSRLPDGIYEDMIISFHTRKEEFKLTPHPNIPTKHNLTFHLLNVREQLAMFDHSSTTHVEVWLLKDYDKKEWALEYRISAEVLFGEQILDIIFRKRMLSTVIGLGVWEHGLIFCMEGDILGYYNPKTDSVKFVRILHYLSSLNRRIISYNRSLVSLKKNSRNMLVPRVGVLRNNFDLSKVGPVKKWSQMKN